MVNNVADFYDLKPEQLLNIVKVYDDGIKRREVRFRDKTISNLLTSIEESKKAPERVLFYFRNTIRWRDHQARK